MSDTALLIIDMQVGNFSEPVISLSNFLFLFVFVFILFLPLSFRLSFWLCICAVPLASVCGVLRRVCVSSSCFVSPNLYGCPMTYKGCPMTSMFQSLLCMHEKIAEKLHRAILQRAHFEANSSCQMSILERILQEFLDLLLRECTYILKHLLSYSQQKHCS